MDTPSIRQKNTRRRALPAASTRVRLAMPCVAVAIAAALTQDAIRGDAATPPQETRQPPAQEQLPAHGLLDAGATPSARAQLVDGDVVFGTPGPAPYVKDIRLSDNFGGLRVFSADTLGGTPDGAAIQLFGNSFPPFAGQLYLDSGAVANAAVIFRTAGAGGTITERMRIGTNGNVGIGTSFTTTARLNVIAQQNSGAISAFSPNVTSITGSSTSNRGVAGFSTTGIGVLGNSLSGIGVRGSTNSTGGLAGQFDGNVQILGNLTKSSGSFKIDHPLDPANKYLSHSFVESPEMLNVYNGVVVLDDRGAAVVSLPDWFEALNRDFRYQLTPIGAPSPDLHIAAEISGNRFRIGGGTTGVKVSWQVTGVRRDAYAEANRIKVEEDKPRHERGTYLNPAAFNQPRDKGLARSQLRDRP